MTGNTLGLNVQIQIYANILSKSLRKQCSQKADFDQKHRIQNENCAIYLDGLSET